MSIFKIIDFMKYQDKERKDDDEWEKYDGWKLSV